MAAPATDSDLNRVRRWSPFFASLTDASPGLFDPAADVAPLDADGLLNRYRTFSQQHADMEVPARLRLLRRREMARIVFRDLTRQADLEDTTRELSALADYCVATALEDSHRQMTQRFGTPRSADGGPVQLVVLGLGKLGAYELNLSSDIDLIIFYRSSGFTDGEKSLSNQEFFIRVCRQLVACLDDSSSIDNVFRVDLRLRPYGDSGPLVLSRAAMEHYYLEQGRDWERYAFIKARVIAGDFVEGADFLNWMKPFIFRRHLDYGAIQSLREMKALIARQVELKETRDDLKLGSGGIREIEFIAQAHQLIWGGRHLDLQASGLLTILDRLADAAFMEAGDVSDLKAAYRFLRNSEHAIQAEYDRQTQRLPTEPESRQRLAEALGFADFEEYEAVLGEHRGRVMACFAELITNPDKARLEVGGQWLQAWQHPTHPAVIALREQVTGLELQEDVMASVDRLVPALLMLAADTEDPDMLLARMIPVVEAILRRSTYIVFLLENLDALQRAVELTGLSPWFATQLQQYPILLYELTDRALRQVAVSKLALQGDLRELLRTVTAGDLEAQMDTLRQFKLAATLKIAAMELTDRLSIMEASDGLTALAEVVLDSAVDMARTYLVEKHGEPCDSEGQPLAGGFAVIAYGKAGGLELAYGSDLDLVFLSIGEASGETDGHKPVNNNVFFVRLGQRLVHILTSFTRFGVLYDADLRLRPQGNKGPLVASLGAFERYLENDAWTWEHQALVRARFVAGDPSLGAAFNRIRLTVLGNHRDQGSLLQDVLSMREKMRTHLGSPSREVEESGMDVLTQFDLKHDPGAIVDIEFMVQYAVLGWAETHPSLGRWTDVMRILDDLGQAEILEESEVDSLQRAYLAFRAAVHHGGLGLETDYGRLQQYRNDVQKIWEHRMLEQAR